jgi:peptidoglycan/LPS O-acetylase OafA/YrhL
MAASHERVGRAPAPARATRWAALDGIRGIAVTLVVLVHSGNALWPAARAWLCRGGALGVHLFFVLSGFLITTVLLDEADRRGRIDLRAFAGRRARRLVPALVVLLGALAVLAAIRPRLPLRIVASSAVYVLSFTANWQINGHDLPLVERVAGHGGLPVEVLHTWSLAIEVQFYVLWATALWFAVRRGWSLRRIAALTAAVVAGIVVARIVAYERGTDWLRLYFSTWSRLDAPLIGALAALALRAGWLARRTRALTVAGVAGLAAFVAVAFLTDWSLPALPLGLYSGLAVCGAAAVAAVVVSPGTAVARGLSWRPLVLLGTISYSLYLWHYPIFWTIERRDPAWPGPLRLVLGVGLALAAATASYVLVERRFLRCRSDARRRISSQGEGYHDPGRWAQDARVEPASTPIT